MFYSCIYYVARFEIGPVASGGTFKGECWQSSLCRGINVNVKTLSVAFYDDAYDIVVDSGDVAFLAAFNPVFVGACLLEDAGLSGDESGAFLSETGAYANHSCYWELECDVTWAYNLW